MSIKLTRYKEVELKTPQPHGIAVYGEPMSGKTTFAGKSDKPLFLSFDGNAVNAGYNAESPQNYDDIMEVINVAEDFGYKTIVIDTVEDMAQLLETDILKKYKADSLKTANGGYGAGYSEFNKNFTNIINALSRSELTAYYLMRAQNTEEGLDVVLKEKLFNIIGGYSDGLIEINKNHESKWIKKRYEWSDDQLNEPLNTVVDTKKLQAKKLEELGLGE